MKIAYRMIRPVIKKIAKVGKARKAALTFQYATKMEKCIMH